MITKISLTFERQIIHLNLKKKLNSFISIDTYVYEFSIKYVK